MATKYNPCLTKDDARTYLETYNCEYIKSPKPTRFERAMVSAIFFPLLVDRGVARQAAPKVFSTIPPLTL